MNRRAPHSHQMRILRDEDLPRRLGALLVGHDVSTVWRSLWTGIKNGKLPGLAAAEFDVLLTMDQNLEFQQNLSTLPTAVRQREAEPRQRLAPGPGSGRRIVP